MPWRASPAAMAGTGGPATTRIIHMAQITAISTANGYRRPVRTKARASTMNASIRQPVT